MSPETAAQAVGWIYEQGLAAQSLTVVWHAGEPLILPRAWYEETFRCISERTPEGAILVHAMQTNATLINQDWCDFFQRNAIRVGVSLDGPAWLHDSSRVKRSGQGTHAAVMKGLGHLNAARVPYHAICVLTEASLDHPDAIADFFLESGIDDVGFNVEEAEGVNLQSSLGGADLIDRYTRFLDRMLSRAEASGRLCIREADWLVQRLVATHAPDVERNDENSPFALVTVTSEGGICTWSPELAQLEHPQHGKFVVGDVFESTLDNILKDARFRAMQAEIDRGVAMCAGSCPYFKLCGGGAPANKLSELGSMEGDETNFCRLSKKTTSEVILRRLERQLALAAPIAAMARR